MELSKLINTSAREQSPYMGGLVNHLPMGQFALFKLTQDLDRVASYTEYYNKNFKVDSISDNYTPASSLEECLGKRDSYEACLDLINNEIRTTSMDHTIRHVLNTYPLGISSGIFHVTIRLAYATEAATYDDKLFEEVARALAYYVTAYHEITPTHRKTSRDKFQSNLMRLLETVEVRSILDKNLSLGKTLKAFYQNPAVLDKFALIEGDEKEKIQGMLDVCLPAFIHTQSIIALHCITGLHAMIVLKNYFEDFSEALDIYTAAVTAHLLTISGISFHEADSNQTLPSWSELIAMGIESKAVHTLKFTYTCHELYDDYPREGLKIVLLNQITK